MRLIDADAHLSDDLIRLPLRKAIFDRIIAGLLLLILALPLLLIALLIRLDTPGPVLFFQPRIGFGNRLFTMLKFRTMHHDCTDLLCDMQTTIGDPRVTRVGRWLRRFSLDELPQLLNVLIGDMSLVGPRPHAPNTKAEGLLFETACRDYPRRHVFKPGITGWAQVNGFRGQTHTIRLLEDRVRHDLHYIERWSLAFDVWIIVLTVAEVFRARAF